MGVPKFFRYLSDRYPCINRTIKEHEIPKYDNLYLDMNSIIHTCSHPSDCDAYFRVGIKEFSDDDIFLNVSRYVELIFNIIKPMKLMFLAFDGVAPRAKMNQQRANRFRVVKEANKNITKETSLEKEILFDGNCITPGTIFMAELVDHMKHFIAFKISSDPLWQKCKIFLSGSEVPGEGEHKIMNFIRYNKAQSSYNPNTRHCLYSLDADLIMLGLSTHEPHFSLIRENIAFGKSKRMLTPEESDFHLLHLSVVREYLEYEFSSVKKNLKFDFDLEKIIDDWILLEFLVGNDFIPTLPNLHIIQGALSFIYKTYIEILPTIGGYMNEGGHLNLFHFEKFIKRLSLFETMPEKSFQASELNKQNEQIQIESVETKLEKLIFEPEKTKFMNNEMLQTSLESKNEKRKLTKKIFMSYYLENNQFYTCEDDILTNKKECNGEKKHFELLKKEYYENKFKFGINESDIKCVVKEYIRAIQWTLSYYYHGCSSWSWYYPYHYSPLISDLKDIQNISLNFDMGKPFLPLQHLMAVIPSVNSHLLPLPLQPLLTNSNSPIIDFYPENFETDLNGKCNDWEALVLIPFINEERLIEAMEPFISKLNKKEQKRNINGFTCVFTHSKTSLGEYPVDTLFESFTNYAQLEYLKNEDLILPEDKLVKGLCPNVSFRLSFPAFPTLKYIPHSFGLESVKTENNSNQVIEKMILNVNCISVQLEDVSKKLLGQTVLVNWPHLSEALVVGVTDLTDAIFLKNFYQKVSSDNLKHLKLDKTIALSINEELASLTKYYWKDLGINIGETKILVNVIPVMGKKQVINSKNLILQPKYNDMIKFSFPYQLIIKEEKVKSITFTLFKTVDDILAPSSSCFIIGPRNYGSLVQIKKIVDSSNKRVVINLKKTQDLNLSTLNEDLLAPQTKYKKVEEIASASEINSIIIRRITSSLKVLSETDNSKFYDIGLSMKLPKYNRELLGYIKKKKGIQNDYWCYSDKVTEVLKIYKEKFPKVFENLAKNPTNEKFFISDIFPEGIEELLQVKVWLDNQKSYYPMYVECFTKTIGLNVVPKLENCISNFSAKNESTTTEIEIPSKILFKPGTTIGLVPPDEKAYHKLLDRIVCVRENYTVPVGLKGIIIGIQEKNDRWKNTYEILFDSPFIGGLTLYGSSEHRCYRLSVADFINISYGKRNSTINRKSTTIETTKSNDSNKTSIQIISIEPNITGCSTSGNNLKNARSDLIVNENLSVTKEKRVTFQHPQKTNKISITPSTSAKKDNRVNYTSKNRTNMAKVEPIIDNSTKKLKRATFQNKFNKKNLNNTQTEKTNTSNYSTNDNSSAMQATLQAHKTGIKYNEKKLQAPQSNMIKFNNKPKYQNQFKNYPAKQSLKKIYVKENHQNSENALNGE